MRGKSLRDYIVGDNQEQGRRYLSAWTYDGNKRVKFGKNQALGVKERRISGLQWPVTERQMGGVGTEEKWNAING